VHLIYRKPFIDIRGLTSESNRALEIVGSDRTLEPVWDSILEEMFREVEVLGSAPNHTQITRGAE
jgi:hypothetical protein